GTPCAACAPRRARFPPAAPPRPGGERCCLRVPPLLRPPFALSLSSVACRKLGMRFPECKPPAAAMVPGNRVEPSDSEGDGLAEARAADKKKPGCCQPGLGVWERMPERPAPYAGRLRSSQVRKAQRVLRLTQHLGFSGGFRGVKVPSRDGALPIGRRAA